ncbi:hypothetical protein L6452_18260 [Arctium lappa]|uniref:Uncharacterized protein n=1 Tax=Arctium lappa TaxID=4217 RepID=A0ACB9C5M8_ARCLA|nr:hypothetical protein L6452_18260 [Arctium lappa]
MNSLITVYFSNSSNASNSDDISSLLNDGFDFLNSDGDLDECIAQFDFISKLPNHSSFVVSSFGLPCVYEKGETSTKVDKSVSMKAKVAKGKKMKSGHSQKRSTLSSSKDFQRTSAEKASLSLKSVQSQFEESKFVSEFNSESVSEKASLSLKSVQRQSHGKT